MQYFLKKISSNTLAKGSAFVFVGMMVSNVGAYLYHLLLGRTLGPSGYGELSSLISLLYIFGVPTAVLQTILVKYFSIYKAKEELGQAKTLYVKITKILISILFVTVIVLLFFSPLIANFLHLSNWRALIWVFLLLILSTLSSINGSVTQGFQLFIWVAVLSSAGAMFKLGISIPFSYYGVEATMIAAVIAALVFYILYFFPIRFLFSAKSQHITLHKKDFLSYGIPTFLSLLSMTSLYSIDVVLARHYLPTFDAGIYASVAVLGKVIFYASSAIATVLFPILAERHAKKEKVTTIVGLAVVLVSAVSLGVTICYIFFPTIVTHLLFGPSYDAAASYLGIFGVFISCYSIVNIFMMALLALEKMRVWILTSIAALVQIGLIVCFHQTISGIIAINIGVTGALLIGVVGYYWYGIHKHHHSSL